MVLAFDGNEKVEVSKEVLFWRHEALFHNRDQKLVWSSLAAITEQNGKLTIFTYNNNKGAIDSMGMIDSAKYKISSDVYGMFNVWMSKCLYVCV